MKSIKRINRITAVLLCLIFAISPLLTSCHKARSINAFDVPDSFDTEREYNITFWAKNDTNVTQAAIYNQAIEDFEALYPNIHVTMKLYTNYINIYNDVITNIATNTTPNVCITYPDHIATYMTGENVIVPLDDLMADEEYGLSGSGLRFASPEYEEIVAKFLEECSIGGVHYALPFMRSTEACYVNKTFVEALGYELPEVLTWDFVWEVSEAALARNSDGTFVLNGQNTMIPFIYKSTDNMLITMLRQLGGGYSTASGEVEIFNETTRSLLEIVSAHSETGAFSTFRISGYPANFLNAGQCIFAVDSTAGATWMGSDAPNVDIDESRIVDFETAVYPVPQFDTENPQMISQGPSVCVFNKADSQEVLASWIFAQFLLTNEVQVAYSMTEGYLPVTAIASQTEEYRDYMAGIGQDSEHYEVKILASKLLMDNIDNTFTTPVFNGSTSLREASEGLIESTVKAVRRHVETNDEFYDGLYEDINSQYRLDQIVTSGNAKTIAELGPLPTEAVILLISLGLTWLLIGTYVVYARKGKNKE